MTTALSSSTAVVPARPVLSDQERQALAGYTGLIREAYGLDLRQFTAWCARYALRLFDVRRAGAVSAADHNRDLLSGDLS